MCTCVHHARLNAITILLILVGLEISTTTLFYGLV